jgi:hypothetical protein
MQQLLTQCSNTHAADIFFLLLSDLVMMNTACFTVWSYLLCYVLNMRTAWGWLIPFSNNAPARVLSCPILFTLCVMCANHLQKLVPNRWNPTDPEPRPTLQQNACRHPLRATSSSTAGCSELRHQCRSAKCMSNPGILWHAEVHCKTPGSSTCLQSITNNSITHAAPTGLRKWVDATQVCRASHKPINLQCWCEGTPEICPSALTSHDKSNRYSGTDPELHQIPHQCACRISPNATSSSAAGCSELRHQFR